MFQIYLILGISLPFGRCCNIYSDFCDNGEADLLLAFEDSDEEQSRDKRNVVAPWDRLELAGKVSETLDMLFAESAYDKRLRPDLGNKATNIEVNLAIRSMGPVDETKQSFTLDCYFRQFWVDKRLQFNGTNLRELAMNWQFLSKIWRPDTYFLNGKHSYLHKIAVPNRFIRIGPNGRISYSQRLTVTARCTMDLRKFPLDSQACPLEIGSFGFNTGEMTYSWSQKPVSMEDDLELAQYRLVKWTHFQKNVSVKNGNRSVVKLVFYFERAVGFYILQVYVPLTIIVMSSWVTFWLVKTEKGQETPARTQLGATTVLAVVTIGFGGKAKPQVGYATALDVFIIICFVSVFTALIEFSFINFLDMFIRRLKHRDLVRVLTLNDMTRSMTAPLVHIPHLEARANQKADSVLQKTGDEVDLTRKFSLPGHHRKLGNREMSENDSSSGINPELQEDLPSMLQVLNTGAVEPEVPTDSNSIVERCWGLLFNKMGQVNWLAKVRKTQLYHDTPRVINRLDQISRTLFPLLFTVLNIVYWASYLYIL